MYLGLILVFQFAMLHFAERLDRDIKDLRSKLFTPLSFWIMGMFEMMFNRNLFTNVQRIEIVVYFQFLGLFKDLIFFPVRISSFGSKAYCKLARFFKRYFKIIGKKDPESMEEEVRYSILVSDLYSDEN